MTLSSKMAVIFVLAAAAISSFARKEETLQELVAKAESARPEDRPGLYVEAAERQLKAADDLYEAGRSDEANGAVNDVATYSQKAQESALQAGKRLKQTEIALRKMAARLRDIRRTLSFEDQAPVQAVADKLENLRIDLQKRMFSKNK